MNKIQKTNRKIISSSFYLAVRFIRLFHNMKNLQDKKWVYLNYPKESIGYKVSQCLIENKLDLIPFFEHHDLKHVVLKYDMTAVDEIKLQAFMFGNGNHSLPCILILIFGLILLPDEWTNLYTEYKKGKKSIPISSWQLDELSKFDIKNVNTILNNNSNN